MFPCAACAGYAAQYDLSEEDVLILQEPWKDKKIPDGVTALLDDKSSHAVRPTHFLRSNKPSSIGDLRLVWLPA